MSALACTQQWICENWWLANTECYRIHRGYSPRKASIGSTAATRRAGIVEATSASANTAIAANASTAGSNGLTSNRKERIRREATAAPANPVRTPTAASFTPEISTSRRMSFLRNKRHRWQRKRMAEVDPAKA